MGQFFGYDAPTVYLYYDTGSGVPDLRVAMTLPSPRTYTWKPELIHITYTNKRGERRRLREFGYLIDFEFTWGGVAQADMTNLVKIANHPGENRMLLTPHNDQGLLSYQVTVEEFEHSNPRGRAVWIDMVRMVFRTTEALPIRDYDNMVVAKWGALGTGYGTESIVTTGAIGSGSRIIKRGLI